MAAEAICPIPGCDNPIYGKSEYCRPHYRRWKTHGDPLGGKFYADNVVCAIGGCDKKPVARNLCGMHWVREKRNGDPSIRTLRVGREAEIVAWITENVGYQGDDCLIGPLAKPNRYTCAYVGGESGSGHRLMCQAAHGDPPTDKPMALHSCGNGHLGCLNPKHLRWGSHQDNMDDKRRHGRMKGILHPAAKLNEGDVSAIRSSKQSNSALAERYGV